MNNFVTHACEQVLRFTSVQEWDILSDERKLQLAFNLGVAVLGLDLSKQEGYDALIKTHRDETSMQELHSHLRSLITAHNVPISDANISKPI